MTLEEFKTKTTIASVLQARGIEVPHGKNHPNIKCPFHDDKNPSFSINTEKNVWFCHGTCKCGGSVVDLMARLEGVDPREIIKKYVTTENNGTFAPPAKPIIEKIYSYQNAVGKEVFQVVRMKPKTFRQRHMVNGEWVWSMEGVVRVLYRLTEVLKAERVWITEGEKDADNLNALGYIATCNVGGAGKWMESYTEDLEGKEIVLCGDNDKAGQDHIDKVFDSISGKVKNVRRLTLPSSFKDVSDYIASFTTRDEAKMAIDGIFNSVPVLIRGIHVPIFALHELEDGYREHIRSLKQNQLSLGTWLPSLGRCVRGLVAGELITILAATGVGKTCCLQNIAKAAAPMTTIMFEMELPPELIYERFLAVHAGWTIEQIEQAFTQAIAANERMGPLKNLEHVYVCTEPRMGPGTLEKLITRSELKSGSRAKVVLLDYMQLMSGVGSSRYERMSNVAEELKIIAKSTRTILIVASQIHRSDSDDPEVGLFDAKDSGSIENSSSLVLGVWRDAKDKQRLWVKILKNTKGTSGTKIPCQFKGETMQIVETVIEPTASKLPYKS